MVESGESGAWFDDIHSVIVSLHQNFSLSTAENGIESKGGLDVSFQPFGRLSVGEVWCGCSMMLSSLLLAIWTSDFLRGHGAMLSFLVIFGLLVCIASSAGTGEVGSIKKPEPAPLQELLRVSSLMVSSPLSLLAMVGSRVKVAVALDRSMVSLKSLPMSGCEIFSFRGTLDFPTPVLDFPFADGRPGPRLVSIFGMSTMSSGLPPVDRTSGLKLSTAIGSSIVDPEETWILSTLEVCAEDVEGVGSAFLSAHNPGMCAGLTLGRRAGEILGPDI